MSPEIVTAVDESADLPEQRFVPLLQLLKSWMKEEENYSICQQLNAVLHGYSIRSHRPE